MFLQFSFPGGSFWPQQRAGFPVRRFWPRWALLRQAGLEGQGGRVITTQPFLEISNLLETTKWTKQPETN